MSSVCCKLVVPGGHAVNPTNTRLAELPITASTFQKPQKLQAFATGFGVVLKLLCTKSRPCGRQYIESYQDTVCTCLPYTRHLVHQQHTAWPTTSWTLARCYQADPCPTPLKHAWTHPHCHCAEHALQQTNTPGCKCPTLAMPSSSGGP